MINKKDMQSLSKFISEGSYTSYERYINSSISKVEPLVGDYPQLKKLLKSVVANYQSINGFLEPLVDFFLEVEKEHQKGLKIARPFIDLVGSIKDYVEYRFDTKEAYYLTLVSNDYEKVIEKNFPEMKKVQGYQSTDALLQVMYDRLWDIYGEEQ